MSARDRNLAASTMPEVQSFPLCADQTVSAAAVDALNRDGVVCIRGAFDQDWLALIEQGIDLAHKGASTDLDVFKRDEDAGSFFMSSGAWMKVAPFHRFIFESHISDLAWSMLDTTELVLFYDFLLVKEAHSNSASTPWHQDHSYYPLDGIKAINCWLALDDIPPESALRFIPGSHRAGQLYRAVDFDQPEQDYRHARKELPLPPHDRTQIAEDIMSAAVDAGDMLIWKSYTLHSAPGNSLDRRRAAFSVNWLGDDIVFNGRPSLETYRDPSQKPGQPIHCEKFPLVRRVRNQD
jgi:ectoine hydroxylase-related dioxygenase (phytanoyl-CoA dioxygenase family)